MSDTHLPILEGCLNLIFSLILVQFMGINGVIIGTIISNVCIIMAARPYYLYRRAFNKSVNQFALHHASVWLLSGLTIAALYYVFIKHLNFVAKLRSDTLLNFLINCAILGVTASIIGGVIFIIGSKDLRMFMKQQILKRV